MERFVCFFNDPFDFNMQAFPHPQISFFQQFILFLHHNFHFLQLQPFFKLHNSLLQRIAQIFFPAKVELDIKFFVPQTAAELIGISGFSPVG